METVFEHYVAQRLRREAPPEIRITTQERLYHLFEESPSGKAFPLRPDIVLRRNGRATEGPVIADTKWKLLCGDPSKNYGISTGDMYQMYAYQKRYAARTILLVYPRHGALASIDSAPPVYQTPGDSHIRIVFFDLDHPSESVNQLLSAATATEQTFSTLPLSAKQSQCIG